MKYTNINCVMGNVTRHPLIEDIPFETVVDYAADFMKIVGIYPTFVNKTAVIDVVKYRGSLPCDFYKMLQVRLYNNTKDTDKNTSMFRYTTDTFHLSEHKSNSGDLTYKLQGGCIFTAPLEEGKIEISYLAFPLDEDGFPLIPDDSIYVRALESFIKKQWFTIQFDLGKINQVVMQKADQDYAWAVGQAQSSLVTPTIDQMESISNMWNTLIIRADHRGGFVNTGAQEHIKVH